MKNLRYPEIKRAIDRGIQYLQSVKQDDRWLGFPTMAGNSDIWVTGFILAHLSGIRDHFDLSDSYQFLLGSRQTDGGWSYNPSVPSDADSTAWCLQALCNWRGFTKELEDESREFMWSHYNGSGICTYRSSSGIREYIGAPEQFSMDGWYASHPDVTMAAILADPMHPNVSRIFKWVREVSLSGGLVPSYWWQSPLYATNLFLRALRRSCAQEEARHLQQIAHALAYRCDREWIQRSCGSNSFEDALILESMTRLYDDSYFSREAVDEAGMALLTLQREDGSWAGDFILRIPVPSVLDPCTVHSWNNMQGGGNARIFDEHGLFSTVMACYALSQWIQIIS